MHFPGCKARSRWRFVDTHFQDILAMFSQPFLTRKASYSSIMNEHCSKTILIFHDTMPIIDDAPLMLTFEHTLETY